MTGSRAAGPRALRRTLSLSLLAPPRAPCCAAALRFRLLSTSGAPQLGRSTLLSRFLTHTPSAGAIPVVALSLLCKSIFGSGLPGPLGLVEGLAWLVLPLGAGTLFPRLVEIAGSPNDAFAILSRDTRGESASERVARITAVTDPSSALGMQLADLAKAKALRAAMSSSERDASDKKNKELAMLAINGVGKGISVSDEAKAAAVGREGLLNQPLGETMKAGMTTENFSKDVASMSDSELMGSQLSKPEMK